MSCRMLHLVIALLFVFSPLQLLAAQQDVQGMIDTLSGQIETAGSDEELAKLCCFRARHYTKIKETEKARQDYHLALETDYKGWILKEYGYFLYRSGEYGRAYNTAIMILEDFPYLKAEAKKLGRMARAKYEEQYLEDHPPEIVMDTVVDPNRKSRHDYRQAQKNQVINFNKLSSTSIQSGST